ncbi:MAG: monooxygenase, partial [Myxococcota bacterium]|nr:monooxygenase [Myxococcota bacterium]
LHGMHVHGFPNCFLMSNAQAGFTANYPHLLNEQAKHLAYIVRKGTEAGARAIEATPEGEQAWVEQCIAKARNAGDFLENCTPGYYNNEGKVGERSAQDGFYGGGSIEFFRILEAWRVADALEGMELR